MPERPPSNPEYRGAPETFEVGSEHEDIVFATSHRTGSLELRSSAPGRKAMVLKMDENTDYGMRMRMLHGGRCVVRVIEDTNPADPNKGKLIVELVRVDVDPPTVDPVEVEVEVEPEPVEPLPIEIDLERRVALVLESEISIREPGEYTPSKERFKHFTLDARTLEALEKIATAVELNEPCLLEGETSTSKTSSIEYLAAMTGHQVRRLNLNGQTDTSELVGKFVPNDGTMEVEFADVLRHPEVLSDISRKIVERAHADGRSLTLVESQKIASEEGIKAPDWKWQDGIIPDAMKKGHWVILDEMNLAEPQVLERLNSVLEKHKTLVLSEDHGRVIGGNGGEPVHDDFRLFGTMNPAEYAGRSPMSPAYKDRWTSYMYVQPPSPEQYSAMIDLMITGEQPKVEMNGITYKGEKSEPMFKTLERVPGLRETLTKVVAFHAGMEAKARTREIGKNKKEKYIFTRRGLIEFMDFLERKTVVDRRTQRRQTVENAPNEIVKRALKYYYLDKITDPSDLAKAVDLQEMVGLRFPA